MDHEYHRAFISRHRRQHRHIVLLYGHRL
jgi:hypothetical protein